MLYIKIADYTTTPIHCGKLDGPNSGNAFYREILLPVINVALVKEAIIVVDLDGTTGFSECFLVNAFTKVGSVLTPYQIESIIVFVSIERPEYIVTVKRAMRNRI